MLPSDVPAAVLLQLADGAPTSPTPPLPTPLRAPRGRIIELPSTDVPKLSFYAKTAMDGTAPQRVLH